MEEGFALYYDALDRNNAGTFSLDQFIGAGDYNAGAGAGPAAGAGPTGRAGVGSPGGGADSSATRTAGMGAGAGAGDGFEWALGDDDEFEPVASSDADEADAGGDHDSDAPWYSGGRRRALNDHEVLAAALGGRTRVTAASAPAADLFASQVIDFTQPQPPQQRGRQQTVKEDEEDGEVDSGSMMGLFSLAMASDGRNGQNAHGHQHHQHHQQQGGGEYYDAGLGLFGSGSVNGSGLGGPGAGSDGRNGDDESDEHILDFTKTK